MAIIRFYMILRYYYVKAHNNQSMAIRGRWGEGWQLRFRMQNISWVNVMCRQLNRDAYLWTIRGRRFKYINLSICITRYRIDYLKILNSKHRKKQQQKQLKYWMNNTFRNISKCFIVLCFWRLFFSLFFIGNLFIFFYGVFFSSIPWLGIDLFFLIIFIGTNLFIKKNRRRILNHFKLHLKLSSVITHCYSKYLVLNIKQTCYFYKK